MFYDVLWWFSMLLSIYTIKRSQYSRLPFCCSILSRTAFHNTWPWPWHGLYPKCGPCFILLRDWAFNIDTTCEPSTPFDVCAQQGCKKGWDLNKGYKWNRWIHAKWPLTKYWMNQDWFYLSSQVMYVASRHHLIFSLYLAKHDSCLCFICGLPWQGEWKSHNQDVMLKHQ